MRNNFFYILIICVFTEILTENEEKKPTNIESIKHTREFFEEEAKKDIENLLMSMSKRNFSAEIENDEELVLPKDAKMMARIDKVLINSKFKKPKRKHKVLRQNKLHYTDNFDIRNMQNLPYHVKSSFDSNIESIKSRISGGQDVKPLSRTQTSQVNIKPNVYPIFTNGNENVKNVEIASSDGTIRSNDQYYVNGNDASIKLINQLDTNHKNGTIIRTTIPITKTYNIDEFLNQLGIKGVENVRTQIVSDNNLRMSDHLNKFYTQSPRNRFLRVRTHSDDFNHQVAPKDRVRSDTIILNNDVIKENSANNDQEDFMKYFNIGKNLRTSRNTMSYEIKEPKKQFNYRSRKKRSINTQAGYTQDPDTCKKYNENLAKLWSKLSKLINVTEQPNDRALHNIAMMIQAYLEHQNAKQTPAIIKERHDGPRGKISEIIIKIKSLLADGEGSAERITKIIKKHLKPDYTDAQSEDCKEINQEYLNISVDLLYKNYLENVQCQGEEDGIMRTEKQSLREKNGRSSTGKTIESTAADDFKPEYQTIHFEDELYNDFQKGKIPRRRRINKNRRVFKSSKNQRSRPTYRAGNEKTRTRSKSGRKRHKNSLKSSKGRCESYAIRQLMVSLRSVMERFNGRLECQLDNTLRSLDSDSQNPYYPYASKFYSEADSLHTKRTESKSPAKNTGRTRNNSRDTSIENNQDVYMRDDEDSESIGESSLDHIKSMNSATSSTSRDTNDREPATYKNKHHANTDNNEFFVSPPFYNDYGSVYKKNKEPHSNEFSSVPNRSEKTAKDKQSNKELFSSNKEAETENSDEYDYYDEMFTVQPNNVYIVDQEKVPDYVETPFTDLTKLRRDDQLIAEKSKTHVKTFESIAEFFKKARETSMQTPEFAVPFALDTNKGYVELTHLIKYPKIIVYRPQFLVKNTMPYDDFLKTINNINMTNEDVRLMKIVRHMPDSSVKVLFETEDFEAPLEVRNLNEKNRRSGWPYPVENYQESLIDTDNDSTNTDMTDEDRDDFMSFDEPRIDLDELAKSNLFTDVIGQPFSPDIKPESDYLKVKEKTSPNIHFENNSDSNSTLNSETNSTESSSGFSSIPNLSTGLLTDNSSSDSNIDIGKPVGSDLGSQLSPGMELGVEPLLKLGTKSNPMPNPQWRSFFSKVFGSKHKSHSRSHIDSNSSSVSSSISHSHALSPEPDSDNIDQEVASVAPGFYSSAQATVLQWWRKWKTVVKDKIQDIVGKMASLANKIDHVIRV